MMTINIMRTLVLLTAILAALSATAAQDLSSYTFDLAVLTVPADPQASMEVVGPPAGQPVGRRKGQQARVWPGVSEVRFGELVLTLGEGPMLWNGDPAPPAGSGVQQLIHRRVSLLTRQPTQIRAIVDDLHYFEAVESGLFEMKSLRKRDLPGLLLDCEVEGTRNSAQGRLVDFDYKLRLVVVESRVELPGAPDRLGKPKLARFSLGRSEETPAGAWHLVSGHLVSDTGGSRQGSYLLVLIRITPVEERP